MSAARQLAPEMLGLVAENARLGFYGRARDLQPARTLASHEMHSEAFRADNNNAVGLDRYANSDPVNFQDPTGRTPKGAAIGGGIGLGFGGLPGAGFGAWLGDQLSDALEPGFDGPLDWAGGLYDDQDRMHAWGTSQFTYRDNGELATRTSDGIATNCAYDAAGNLRRVARQGMTIDYVIDGLNRRVGKKVSGVLTRGWIYDGSRIVAEVGAGGAVVSKFVYGSRPHVPDLMVTGTKTYRLVTDQLGSVRLVVDITPGAGNGNVVQRTDYDEWGQVTASSGTLAGQPFGFAGGLYDADTGLVRFGARDYDPTVGRWTSKDASRFAGGLNLYGYANSDPVNYVDPDGHHPLWLVAIAAEELGGYAMGAGALGYLGTMMNPPDSGVRMGATPLISKAGGACQSTQGDAPASPNDPDQDAVIQTAKDAKRGGGVSSGDWDTLKGWADEYGVPARGPEVHPGRPQGQYPHGHVGPVDHIPVH